MRLPQIVSEVISKTQKKVYLSSQTPKIYLGQENYLW